MRSFPASYDEWSTDAKRILEKDAMDTNRRGAAMRRSEGREKKEREVVKRRTMMDAQTEYRNNNAYNLSSSRVGSFFFLKLKGTFA